MTRTAVLSACLVLAVALQMTRAQPQAGQPEIVLQTGHTAIMWALAASPDGRLIASAGSDRTIKIWSLFDARLWRTFDAPFSIEALAFSPDGRVLASSADDEITLSDVTTGSQIRRIDACDDVLKIRGGGDIFFGKPSAVAALAFSPKGQFLASACDGDESVKVWDLATGREIRRFNVPSKPPGQALFVGGFPEADDSTGFSSIAFDASGRWLAAGTADHTVRVWEFSTGTQTPALRGHSRDVRSLAFSADGRFITGSDAQRASLWNIASGATVRTRRGVWSAFDAQGQWIVVGSGGNVTASAIEGPGGERSAGNFPPNLPVVLSPDGRWLIGSDDKTLVARNLAARTDIRLLDVIVAKRRLVLSPDGSLLALQPFSSNDTKLSVKLWNLRTNDIRTLSGPGGYNASFSRDNRVLAAAAEDKKIRLWDAATANELRVFNVDGYISTVSLNTTGSVLAASGSKETRVWDVNRNLALPGYSSNGTVFSPDSRWLAHAADNSIQIVDAATGQTTRTITGLVAVFGSRPMTFSPDGRMLAGIADGTTVKIWDVSNGQEVRTLTGHSSVSSMTFSPDRRWFALRDKDENVFLWDLEGGREVRRLSGYNIGFTAGGAFLWTTGADGITRFWTPENGALAASLAMIEGSNDWAVATPDGRFDGTTMGIQKLVAWRSGDLVLPLDQFMDRRAPGLLARLLTQ